MSINLIDFIILYDKFGSNASIIRIISIMVIVLFLIISENLMKNEMEKTKGLFEYDFITKYFHNELLYQKSIAIMSLGLLSGNITIAFIFMFWASIVLVVTLKNEQEILIQSKIRYSFLWNNWFILLISFLIYFLWFFEVIN